MPFTFSHPAIVLPFCKLKKIPFSITGLVMGSIAPDMEFLFRMIETNSFAHRWPGIVWFNIPFALAFSFIFHYFFRNPLILHLPKFFRQRLTPFLFFNWVAYFKKNRLRFLVSVCIGILSHIFLDAFTHEDGIFVTMNVAFYQTLVVFNQPLPVYVVLQLASSVAGAIYIVWFVAWMKKATDVKNGQNIFVFWGSMIVIFAGCFILRVVIDKAHQKLDDIVVAWFGCGVYAFMITCVLYYNKTKHILIKNPR